MEEVFSFIFQKTTHLLLDWFQYGTYFCNHPDFSMRRWGELSWAALLFSICITLFFLYNLNQKIKSIIYEVQSQTKWCKQICWWIIWQRYDTTTTLIVRFFCIHIYLWVDGTHYIIPVFMISYKDVLKWSTILMRIYCRIIAR